MDSACFLCKAAPIPLYLPQGTSAKLLSTKGFYLNLYTKNLDQTLAWLPEAVSCVPKITPPPLKCLPEKACNYNSFLFPLETLNILVLIYLSPWKRKELCHSKMSPQGPWSPPTAFEIETSSKMALALLPSHPCGKLKVLLCWVLCCNLHNWLFYNHRRCFPFLQIKHQLTNPNGLITWIPLPSSHPSLSFHYHISVFKSYLIFSFRKIEPSFTLKSLSTTRVECE